MKTAFVQLGRMGDILNALPMALKHHDETGKPAHFVVAEAYASVLEGCSYVTPIVFQGAFENVAGALGQLHGYDDIRVAQIYGNGVRWKPRNDSFCRDSWDSCGMLEHFPYKLVFDRRDSAREERIAKRFLSSEMPNILVNLSGNSSPFPQAKEFRDWLDKTFGLFCNIVDLANVKLPYFYDMLGLYDRADLLVTIDTATLHLAQGSNIPAIEFIVERPSIWHGAVPKGNCIFSCRYPEVMRKIPSIIKAMADCVSKGDKPSLPS